MSGAVGGGDAYAIELYVALPSAVLHRSDPALGRLAVQGPGLTQAVRTCPCDPRVWIAAKHCAVIRCGDSNAVRPCAHMDDGRLQAKER